MRKGIVLDESVVVWLGDESTFEVVDWEAGPVVQVLTDKGLLSAKSGIELKAWSSKEYKKYVKQEVSLVDLVNFWNAGHSNNDEEDI